MLSPGQANTNTPIILLQNFRPNKIANVILFFRDLKMEGSLQPNSRKRNKEYGEKHITSQLERFSSGHIPFQVLTMPKKWNSKMSK